MLRARIKSTQAPQRTQTPMRSPVILNNVIVSSPQAASTSVSTSVSTTIATSVSLPVPVSITALGNVVVSNPTEISHESVDTNSSVPIITPAVATTANATVVIVETNTSNDPNVKKNNENDNVNVNIIDNKRIQFTITEETIIPSLLQSLPINTTLSIPILGQSS